VALGWDEQLRVALAVSEATCTWGRVHDSGREVSGYIATCLLLPLPRFRCTARHECNAFLAIC